MVSKHPRSNTREQILAVSLDLFSNNGYSATSVRQIAQNVGVRESSIYNHFQNKEDILKTVLNDFGGFGFINVVLKKNYLDMEIDDPKNMLRQIIDDIMNRWPEPEDSKFARVLFLELFREPAAREAYQWGVDSSRDFFIELFEKMGKMGIIRPIDPWVLANEFLALILFIHIEYVVRTIDGSDVTQLYQYMRYKHVDFFWDAIKV